MLGRRCRRHGLRHDVRRGATSRRPPHHTPFARFGSRAPSLGTEVLRVVRLLARELPRFGAVAPPHRRLWCQPPRRGRGPLRSGGRRRRAPAVEELRASGLDVHGPLPADTAFVRAVRGEFDAVVAAYHDQGLVPVKLLAFGESVNVTLGLPFVRTSVDHGTAFDIAGRGHGRGGEPPRGAASRGEAGGAPARLTTLDVARRPTSCADARPRPRGSVRQAAGE